jgi:hypothetical protein
MSAAAVLPVVWARQSAHAIVPGSERWLAQRLSGRRSLEPQSALRVCDTVRPAIAEDEEPAARLPEISFYRKYTEGMLRRYMRLSMEAGRVPSLIGQPMFRGRVTSYRVRSFEDVVIFVFDVEKCLRQLDERSQELIARISLQEYTQGETAGLTGMSLRSVVRHYAEALDRLTVIFLKAKLLEPRWEMNAEECQAPKKPAAREKG